MAVLRRRLARRTGGVLDDRPRGQPTGGKAHAIPAERSPRQTGSPRMAIQPGRCAPAARPRQPRNPKAALRLPPAQDVSASRGEHRGEREDCYHHGKLLRRPSEPVVAGMWRSEALATRQHATAYRPRAHGMAVARQGRARGMAGGVRQTRLRQVSGIYPLLRYLLDSSRR